MLAAARRQRSDGIFPLAFAEEGAVVEVVEYRGGHRLAHKLAEIGVLPGSVLRVVKSNPPGPVVVEVLKTPSTGPGSGSCPCSRCPFRRFCGGPEAPVALAPRYAIGFGMAMKIYVRRVR